MVYPVSVTAARSLAWQCQLTIVPTLGFFVLSYFIDPIPFWRLLHTYHEHLE